MTKEYPKYDKTAIDKQAEREGKNIPNSNKKHIKLQNEYNNTQFNKLFRR